VIRVLILTQSPLRFFYLCENIFRSQRRSTQQWLNVWIFLACHSESIKTD